MKTHTFGFALALGLLVCEGGAVIAQQLSLSTPIIVRLSEIDRYGVSAWPLAKTMDGATLGLPYRDMKQSDVYMLVRNGTFLNRSVWVMDGARVIAKCSLTGEFGYQADPKSEMKYGLCLGFSSNDEAQKVCSTLRLEPSIDEQISSLKSRANDQRGWN